MSLASSCDSQIRPEDKAFDTLFPADEPPTNFFDEYLNENHDFSDGDNKEALDDFLDFFEETTSREWMPAACQKETKRPPMTKGDTVNGDVGSDAGFALSCTLAHTHLEFLLRFDFLLLQAFPR